MLIRRMQPWRRETALLRAPAARRLPGAGAMVRVVLIMTVAPVLGQGLLLVVRPLLERIQALACLRWTRVIFHSRGARVGLLSATSAPPPPWRHLETSLALVTGTT